MDTERIQLKRSQWKKYLGVAAGLALIYLWVNRVERPSVSSEHGQIRTPGSVAGLQSKKPAQLPAHSSSTKSEAKPSSEPSKATRRLDYVQTEPDAKGQFSEIEVLETSDRFKILRIKKDWKKRDDGTLVMTSELRMPGDHVLVQLAPGANPKEFETYVDEIGAKVARSLPGSGLIVLQFDGSNARAMDRVILDLKKRPDLVAQGVPNYIVKLKK